MTAPISKRADQLVVGDRILPTSLPAVAGEPGEAKFVWHYTYVGTLTVFVAFLLPNGLMEATHYLPDDMVKVYPADTGLDYSRTDEDPQPVAGREPLHFGAVVDEGGHTAVAVAGGLIAIDPPKVFACTAHGVHPHPGGGGGFMVCLDCPECRPPGASVA